MQVKVNLRQGLNLKDWNEVERPYEDGEQNVRYANYDNGLSHFVVLKNGNILRDGVLNPFARMEKTGRSIVEQIGDTNIVRVKTLKERKSVFKDGNYTEVFYRIECVGNKRVTSKLNAGLLFQAKAISVNA